MPLLPPMYTLPPDTVGLALKAWPRALTGGAPGMKCHAWVRLAAFDGVMAVACAA